MKIIAFLLLAVVSTGFAAEREDTMCVKQKNGTYKCKASGKIEKMPCCDTPPNEPAQTPTPEPKK